MHWADKIAREIIKSGKYIPYWVDDMKTPSGYSHVGSMMGPIIHSMIFRALKDAGKEVTYTFVINDFDPADDLLPELKGKFEKHLGKPLKLAPSPVPSFDSMADLFGSDFVKSIQSMGVEAEVLSSWKMYHDGKFDEVIRLALDNADKIQDIYEKVSGSQKKQQGWLPFQVICEKCGKLGTTRVFDWDGEKVSYKCEPKMVKWAVGCGHEGKMSPFGGNGKLPWKVDWAAHWKVIGVTIEGAGKDHASAGGSYDIAMTICKEVFGYEKPYKLPYEFILIGGRKMSSSKGLGIKAHDLIKILPPSVGRFLFARSDIRSQSNFDPDGTMAIPDLFDEYDRAWEAYDKGGDEKLARTYVISQVGKTPEKEKGFFVPRFRDVANYLAQGLPEEDLVGKFEEIKNGKIDDSEYDILQERIRYAKTWIKDYAPQDYRFGITKDIPKEALNFKDNEKKYLEGIIRIYNEDEEPEKLQVSLYELAKEKGIPTKEAFRSIYQAFIGKSHGPRAGMLLAGFGREKVVERINAILSGKAEENEKEEFKFSNIDDKKLFSFSPEFLKTYPTATVGFAVIKGIVVKNKDEDLEKLKDKELGELEGITVQDVEKSAEILSYRRLYKESGVDWAKKKSSPAALLRRIAQGKGLYTINTCVDAYNLVVMKYKVSAGAFDLDKMKLPTVLDIAKGGEMALYIGDKEETKINKGEICYFDKIGPYNLDFNYRDSIRTSVTEATKNILINTEGVYDIKRIQVERTLDEVIKNIVKFCGGKVEISGIYTAS